MDHMQTKKKTEGFWIYRNSHDRLEATFPSNIGNYSRYSRSRHAPICYHSLRHAVSFDDGLTYRDRPALNDPLRAFSEPAQSPVGAQVIRQEKLCGRLSEKIRIQENQVSSQHLQVLRNGFP